VTRDLLPSDCETQGGEAISYLAFLGIGAGKLRHIVEFPDRAQARKSERESAKCTFLAYCRSTFLFSPGLLSWLMSLVTMAC